MADTERKFSELSVAGTLTDNDILALSQTDIGTSTLISVRATLIAIATHIAKVAAFTNDLDTTSKTLIGAINELKQLISLIPQFSIDVVQTLPVSDISETTIYLVPSSDPEQGNYYEEYIYVNNTWELVGTTAVDLSAYYTKLEVDGLLSAKANTSDVTAALALKEAKADMDDDVTDIIVALTDEQTTTPGNPVTLTTEQTGGAKSAVVTFTPKQSGSGDPSPENPRHIIGRDSLSLYITAGINHWDEEWELGYYNLSTGAKVNNPTTIRSKNYIPVLPSTSYYFMCISVPADCLRILWYDSDKNYISNNSANNDTNRAITSPKNAHFCTIYCSTAYGTTYRNDISINYPATDTNYHAHQGKTHTATLGSTYYGGSYDFVSGKGSATFAFATITGDDAWTAFDESSGKFFCDSITANTAKIVEADTEYISNMYLFKGTGGTSSGNVSTDKRFYGQRNFGRFWVYDSDYANDFSGFKTMLNITPLVIAYPLATPTEITLTPGNIELLKGLNTVWSDANGTVTVGYSKLPNGNLGAVVDYIKKLEARIAALES